MTQGYPQAYAPAHIQRPYIVCAHCGVVHASGPTECSYCGAPLRMLEPFALACGFCHAENRRDLVDHCARCGGPLPSLPRGNPGPPPPAWPRALPAGYASRERYWRNVFVLIGMVFTIPFFWTLIFPAIGIPLWIYGSRIAERKLRALTFGVPTRGRLISCFPDVTQQINGRHPWLLRYAFETGHGVIEADLNAWDDAHRLRSPGDVLWIVFVDGEANTSSIWPPLR